MQDINSRFHKSVVYTIVGIMLIPILATFIYSISSRWGATILPDGFTFDWYIKLLTDPRFLQAFGRSLFIGLSALALSVVLVLPGDFRGVLLLSETRQADEYPDFAAICSTTSGFVCGPSSTLC